MAKKRRRGARRFCPSQRFRSLTNPDTGLDWQRQIEASYMSKTQLTFQEAESLGEIILDEAVWSKGLPEDVFCTILACLPLSSFSRMRSVCKNWNAMPRDVNFISACGRLWRSSQVPALCLTSKDGGVWLYEITSNSWKCIPASFFYPEQTQIKCSLLTAAGGRLLFITNSPADYSLMVYNPLNDTKVVLPPMIDRSLNFLDGVPAAYEIHVVGMYEDESQSYYSILATDRRSNKISDDEGSDSGDDSDSFLEPEGIMSQVYDSRSSTWDVKDTFAGAYELSMLNAAVFCNRLHCLTVSAQLSSTLWNRPLVDQLSLYTVIEDGWQLETFGVPTQDKDLAASYLFSTSGRLMVAAAVPLSHYPTLRDQSPKWSIVIWELERNDDIVKERWVKFTTIDLQELDRRQFRVGLGSFFFLSEGDILYFGSNTGTSLGLVNIRTKSWHLLPPFPPHSGDRFPPKKFQTFAYTPRFDLVA